MDFSNLSAKITTKGDSNTTYKVENDQDGTTLHLIIKNIN